MTFQCSREFALVVKQILQQDSTSGSTASYFYNLQRLFSVYVLSTGQASLLLSWGSVDSPVPGRGGRLGTLH